MKTTIGFFGLLFLIIIPLTGIKNISDDETAGKSIVIKPKTILELSDSICEAFGVPSGLVREVGDNESGWRFMKSLSGGTDHGDLQVIEPTFNYWYDHLCLEGGKTRKNYLITGIAYLKYNYDRYGSWKKARFAYARGDWRPEHTWTCLENTFMNKIDWKQYDRPTLAKN